MAKVRHNKSDHEDCLLYEFRDLSHGEGAPSFLLELDPPLPKCLLDRPDWQIEIGGYRIGPQDWHYAFPDEDVIDHLYLSYAGKDLTRYQRARHAQIKIQKPRSQGQYYAIKPGPTRDTVIRGVLQQEQRPDEMECPECEAELFPVPDKCPQCGIDLNPSMPSLGELVDKYGRDAKLDVHLGHADADLDVMYTLSKSDADAENKEKRQRHDEKVALYKEQLVAWGVMMEPFKKAKAVDLEARELAELARLKAKHPDAS